jgi:hypothetical protein
MVKNNIQRGKGAQAGKSRKSRLFHWLPDFWGGIRFGRGML